MAEDDNFKQFKNIIAGNKAQLRSNLESLLLKLLRNKVASSWIFSLYKEPVDSSVKEIIEDFVTNEFIKDSCVDYFIYFCTQSMELTTLLCSKVIAKIVHYDLNTIYNNCEKLAAETNIPIEQVLFETFQGMKSALGYKIEPFFEKLSVEMKTILFAKSLINDRFLAVKFDSLIPFHKDWADNLAKACHDDSYFIEELRFAPQVGVFNAINWFSKILFENIGKVPNFVSTLIDRAAEQGNYTLLLEISLYTEVRRIMVLFVDAGNEELLNRFCNVHKDHPEIKNLIPFS